MSPLRKPQNPILSVCNLLKFNDHLVKFSRKKRLIGRDSIIKLKMKELITKTIDLNTGSPEEKRAEIRNYFLKTWAVDELLYNQLKDDSVFYHRGRPAAAYNTFYLGHTAVFFINKLYLAKIIDRRINPKFESIFAIGVDEMSWDDLDNRHYDWPPVPEVRAYRDEAKELILGVIDNAP